MLSRLRFLIAALLLPLTLAVSQDQSQEKSRSERTRGFDKRLTALIDEFVDGLGDEFGFSSKLPEEPQDSGAAEQDTITFLAQDRSRSTVTFDGATIIAVEETIEGDVVVKGGDLTVYGTVRGDVLVVGGTLYVRDGGRVTGNARVINGDIVRDEGGTIEGYMDKTSSSRLTYREDKGKIARSSYHLDADWKSELTNLDNFIFRFNKVEGFYLGLGSDKRYYWDGYKLYSLYGSVGYGFMSHKWRANLGVTRQFAITGSKGSPSHLLEIGGEWHSYTDSKDQWLIDLNENSTYALLIHEDFRDYYQRQGFTIITGWYMQGEDLTTQLTVEYNIDQHRMLENGTEFAIFGGKKKFRLNPPADEGKVNAVVVSGGISTVTKTRRGPHGWSLYGTMENSRKNFGSDFAFSQLIVDVRRFQPLSRYDGLNLRVRGGTSSGVIPLQRVFEIGGLGTLPGYNFKAEAGNRLFVGNLEYIVNGDFLGDLDFWPSGLMRHVNFVFFGDAGWVTSVHSSASWTDGFDQLSLSSLRTDLGFGFANRNGTFRIAWAWRTDQGSGARFILRFTRPF